MNIPIRDYRTSRAFNELDADHSFRLRAWHVVVGCAFLWVIIVRVLTYQIWGI